MIELARLYYLACELRPNLPEHKLLQVLPRMYTELITSAAKNGISSGIANYEQLATLYSTGEALNIDPTENEFKSLISTMIANHIEDKKDLPIDEKIKYYERLTRYYKQGESFIPQVRRTFNSPAPVISKFSSGFPPYDKVLGGSIVNDVTTIIANPGTGKSYISMAIAAAWPHGSVRIYDPENGEGVVLNRAETLPGRGSEDYDHKELIFGWYSAEDILQELKDNPDHNMLVILDSLHFVCGDGSSPESRANYFHTYKAAVAMKQFCKHVIITTQVKRGANGDSIDAGAASSTIERDSGAQLHLSKGMYLGNGTVEYRLFSSKNRHGPNQVEVNFVFDYVSAKCVHIVEPPVFTQEMYENMEFI
jgi:hypothetical protein